MSSLLRRARGLARRGIARAEDRLLGVREFERLALPPAAALTITSDDGSIKNLEVAAVLSSAGVKGVFAVSPALLGQPGMLTMDHVLRLHDEGHEIAFHGVDDTPFDAYGGTANLVARCQAALGQLEHHRVAPAVVMYPHGIHDRAIRLAASRFASAGFATAFGVNRGEINRYAVKRVPLGAYASGSAATEAWHCANIDRATHRPAWIVLMLHPGADGHATQHTRMLEHLVAYARQALPVVTASTYLGRAIDSHAKFAAQAS